MKTDEITVVKLIVKTYKERMNSNKSHPSGNVPLPFIHMQSALEMAPKSQHPSSKIAATIFGTHENNTEFAITRTNHWPAIIHDKIGIEEKIGNSSGTIHAETACILHSLHATEGASICITEPFCPNCAKNIAEAGIKNIYIDEDGFDKDFFKRRGDDFDRMSMQICNRAGINVYALNMKTQETRTILEIAKDYTPLEDSPITAEPVETINDATFHDIIASSTAQNKRRKFAVALIETKNGGKFAVIARAHAVIGYSMHKPEEALDLLTPQGKYSFIQEPVNRLMMYLSRKGHVLYKDYLYCSQVPTAREQVNLVGANIKRISIGDIQKCRDSGGFNAMQQLKDAGILDYS